MAYGGYRHRLSVAVDCYLQVINGLLILIPRTSALGILAAFPYYLNIFLYTAFIAQIYFKLSIPAFVVTCYLIYAYWDRYRPIVSK
jgi:hypothetical protein